MKNLIQILSAMVVVAAGFTSQARSIQYTGVQATVTKVHVSEQFPYVAQMPWTQGRIQVNYLTNKVNLHLYGPTGQCPDGAVCFAPTYSATISLDIVNQTIGRCGNTVVGQTNPNNPKKPNFIETLVVTDYSNIECRLMPPAITVVQYYYKDGTTENPIGHAFFYADQLVPYLGN
ncbi:MAG: hypothetical protein KDD61_02125 [Bdellovibrionales bacterium]|nr:hypothetical protein [Bdellovibrionales bacterium]